MTAPERDATTVRRGRRPGSGSTREAVLDAARERFAADGFAATTIRRIAIDAGVDASQVIQFFRSKDELFAAVMAVPPEALRRFDDAFEGPAEHVGARVVRAFLETWEGEASESEPLMAMLRGAIVNERAAEQLRGFLQSRLLNGAHGHGTKKDGAHHRGDPEVTLRAGLASSMLVGLITGRRIVGVPALVNADAETLVAIVGPALQLILAAPVDRGDRA